MSQTELIERSFKIDTLSLVGAASDELAGHMLLTKFAQAYQEVLDHLNANEDIYEKGTGSIPVVTILVSTTIERKKKKVKKNG